MALNDEDRIQAEKLLKAYRQRLRYREEQIARMGDTADPSIPIDRDYLEREIGMLEAVLTPDTSPAVAGLIKRRLEDDVYLFQQSVEQNARITKVESRIDKVATEQYNASLWRLDVQAQLTKDDAAAVAGRRRNWRMQLINFGLMLIVLGGLAWLTMLIHR